jgi:hypothetical protein
MLLLVALVAADVSTGVACIPVTHDVAGVVMACAGAHPAIPEFKPADVVAADVSWRPVEAAHADAALAAG